MKNVWVQSANNFYMSETSQQLPVLPVGVYKIMIDPFEKIYLSKVQDKFHFPFKVYGVEREFIDRVKKSYANTTGNFGVMLNGLKGTGKTVTAEILCNELNLPVIVIPFHHKNLVSFLNDLQQDVIIFVDEFEKIYDRYKNSLLTIMDGALKTKTRLFFMLTTNEIRVDPNLLQRPSRIRYVKTFSDLTLEVIMEVVNDLLVHKHLFDQTVKMISELPIITMDLIKSIVQEVNIHEEDPHDFRDIFNIHSDREELFNVYEIKDGSREELVSFATVRPNYLSVADVGNTLYVNGKDLGEIEVVHSDRQVTVSRWSTNDKNEDIETTHVIYMEKATKTHRSFASYSLTF